MKIVFDIPWKRYALIIELAKRLDNINPQFGKTALQKLVFFLQEIYGIKCGYDFELYSYGPFDSQLLGDLDLVRHWGGVTVSRVNNSFGGYRIRPSEKGDAIVVKAKEFIDDPKTEKALDDLVLTYGSMTARDLELRATTVYVERGLRKKGELRSKEKICSLVSQIKPKFDSQEIEQAVSDLRLRNHIEIE